jgi:hypothetical protein
MMIDGVPAPGPSVFTKRTLLNHWILMIFFRIPYCQTNLASPVKKVGANRLPRWHGAAVEPRWGVTWTSF